MSLPGNANTQGFWCVLRKQENERQCGLTSHPGLPLGLSGTWLDQDTLPSNDGVSIASPNMKELPASESFSAQVWPYSYSTCDVGTVDLWGKLKSALANLSRE